MKHMLVYTMAFAPLVWFVKSSQKLAELIGLAGRGSGS